MDVNIEIQLKEPVNANPEFELEVSRFIAANSAAASPVAEGSLWNKGFGVSRQLQTKIDWRRGHYFDRLGGNNLGRYYPRVDYLKGGVVGSIKSTRLTDPKQLEKIVREAYRKMIQAIRTDSNLARAVSAEVKIIVPHGTSTSITRIIERVSSEIHLQHSGIKFNPPKIVRGIPGALGTFLKGMGIAGGFYSAIQLQHDIEKGDVASAIGSGAGAATTLLEIGGGVLSSTALAASAAVVGSFAVGYGAGTMINDHLISEEVKDIIGGTIAEIVDHGWENIKEFYLGK
jgi:hypothetical protein